MVMVWGDQWPERRWAITEVSTPATSARAMVSDCRETPTRKLPLMSLWKMKRCSAVRSRQVWMSRSRCLSGGEFADDFQTLSRRFGARAGRGEWGLEGNQERECFGEIADDGIAFVEHPGGEAGDFAGPVAHLAGGDGASDFRPVKR